MVKSGWAIALHGGAGTISRESMTPERRTAYDTSLAAALIAGRDLVASGGSCVDAVEATVRALERDPLFNAGHGAVLTSDGRFELDSSIMRGKDLAAGAVIGLRHIASPVSLARMVMEQSPYVVLAGEGAETFAKAQGVEFVEQSYFETDYRRQQLQEAKAKAAVMLDHSEGRFGTVGAVARDSHGDLAAATSTGGMTNKAPGRVSDSPIIGAGTYADRDNCAVSATGHGEMFIRMTVARDIAALMQYAGLTLEDAARRKVMVDLPEIGGRGGIISVGKAGAPVFCVNTSGMYRAMQCEGGPLTTGIFAES